MYRIYTVILIVLIIPGFAKALVHNDKFQYRPDIGFGSLFLEMNYRYDGDDIFYRHYDGGWRFPIEYLGNGWSGGIHYRSTYTKSDEDASWDLEKRPHAQLQKKFSTDAWQAIPDLSWIARVRYEYRMRENGDDIARTRYYVKTRLGDDIEGFKPFVANELFYDWDDKRFSIHRFDIGVELPTFEKIKSSVYYRLKTDIDEKELDHTSSMVLKITF